MKRGARKAPKKPEHGAAAGQPPLFYRLHALLHTVRTIQQFEDPLCTLLHTVETGGPLDTEAVEELRNLLDHMPTAAYLHEVQDTRHILDGLTSVQPRAELLRVPAQVANGASTKSRKRVTTRYATARS